MLGMFDVMRRKSARVSPKRLTCELASPSLDPVGFLVRTMMFLSLSYDHRAVDGAPANGFLYRVRELLEAAEFEL